MPEVVRHVAGLYQLFWSDQGIRTFTGCQTAPMTMDTEAHKIQGSIDTTDCPSTKYGINWYADYYTFTGSVGDKISISITASFNKEIILYDPNGAVVQDELVRIPDGREWYTLPVTGTYVLEVTSDWTHPGQRGSYTFTSVNRSSTVSGMCGKKTPI